MRSNYPVISRILAAQQTEAAPIFDATPEKPYEIVYRMEDASGRGPYAFENGSAWGGDRHGGGNDPDPKRHPMPNEDPGFERDDLHELTEDSYKRGASVLRFGFQTPEQARAWFTPEEWEKLESLGFHLVEKKARKIWGSDKQVFYVPLEAAHPAYPNVASLLS